MKLLIDMNLSPSWTDLLHSQGFEATHWSSVGSPSAPDVELIDYATLHGYVILTHDLDFGNLLITGQLTTPSVIQIRGLDLRTKTIGDRVCQALRRVQVELELGAVVTLDIHRERIRYLLLNRPE